MTWSRFQVLLLSLAGALGLFSSSARAGHTVNDYRHFRALAIDLLGRMPTETELAEFERPGFDLDKWTEAHLGGPAYVDRLTRVYQDLLRLEPNLNFSAAHAQLMRHSATGPDGKPVMIFYRAGQRRRRPETDGEFCLTEKETGQRVVANQTPSGTAIPLTKLALDKNTVLVRPWWLYRDYKAPHPVARYGAGWQPDPAFVPVKELLDDPDGKPTAEVRVCREEAETQAMGHILVTGLAKAPPKDAPVPPGRFRQPPVDKAYAIAHKGEPVACDTRLALETAADCGCGEGLERCVPGTSDSANSNGFVFPSHLPLGLAAPLDGAPQQAGRWYPFWWGREAVSFLQYLFGGDRDFREILTSRATVVNGPLAQFYRSVQRGNCCMQEANFGMVWESEPLFDPAKVPADLAATDASTWRVVPDRGPHAAGILTMPIFLEKFASPRSRAALLYNVFLCKSFSAEKAQLSASTEPNLMVRPGCANCHATLEPLASYFARVEPGSFVFLPEAHFPTKNPACKKNKQGNLSGPCGTFYDVAFADDKGALLRGAYGSPAHVDATPVGAGADLTKMPEFASCATSRITSSFLGRPLTSDDDALVARLTDSFTRKGYRVRELVREIVASDAYKRGNNLSSTEWVGSKVAK